MPAFAMIQSSCAFCGFHAEVSLAELIRGCLHKLGGDEHGLVEEMGMVALVRIVRHDSTEAAPPPTAS